MTDHELPLLGSKDHRALSLFEPANLLREARRRKGLPDVDVPAVGLLDPDGDIVRHLSRTGLPEEKGADNVAHDALAVTAALR